MATIKGWFTMNGVHIPIMDGQSKSEAAKNYMNSKHGKTVAKLSSKTSIKKNKFTDSYESIEKAADEYLKDTSRELTDRAYNFYDKLGYTAQAKKVNEQEFDRISKSNEFGVLERGYRGEDGKVSEYIEQFKNGKLYIGEQRAFGMGTYFGYGKEAHSIAREYGQQNDNNILKVTITGNTKIITSEQLSKRRDEFMDKAFKKATEINKTKGSEEASNYYKKMNKIIMHDDGIFAASLGYDAINVTDAKYIVVLNRGKVIVSE